MPRVLHATTQRHALWGGGPRYIRILVHDTTDELRAAAARYRPECADWEGTGACFHPPHYSERYVDGAWVDTRPKGWAGTMRLARDYMEPEVVIHECVHASATIYRLDVKQDIRLGDGAQTLGREESLAYIVGDLTTEVIAVLHAAGEWPT